MLGQPADVSFAPEPDVGFPPVSSSDRPNPHDCMVGDGAKAKPGVAFLRKDAIARWALGSPLTLRESETI